MARVEHMSIPPPPPFGSDQPAPPPYGQQPGYPQPGFQQPGQQPGYQQPGYQQPGYQQPGAPPPGYQPYQQNYQAVPNYGGFGSRLGALIIDGLIGALFYIPAGIAFAASPKTTEVCTINNEVNLCEVPTAAGFATIIGAAAIFGIVYLVIFCRMVGKGQSIGMKALNIRLVSADAGQPIGAWRALGWQLAHVVSGFVCYLGYLWCLWDSRKQTWHDKIVGTVMIKV